LVTKNLNWDDPYQFEDANFYVTTIGLPIT
jgi:hypothetical protein